MSPLCPHNPAGGTMQGWCGQAKNSLASFLRLSIRAAQAGTCHSSLPGSRVGRTRSRCLRAEKQASERRAITLLKRRGARRCAAVVARISHHPVQQGTVAQR